MTQVRWHANNLQTIMNRAQQTGKVNKKYFPSSISDILLNWGPKEAEKFIKVSYGRGNWLEFTVYNSGPYLQQRQKVRKHVQPVDGLFYLMVRSDHKVGDTAAQVLALIDKIGQKFAKLRMENHENWVDLDRMNEMLLEIEEIVENVEEYRVLDELMDSISREEY